MDIFDILPRRFRQSIAPYIGEVEEIRLAVGQRICLTTCYGEVFPEIVDLPTRDELWRIAEAAAGGTLFSCATALRRGYLSLQGGYRLGICGSVNLGDGQIRGFSDISSICIRTPHQHFGCADSLPEVFYGEFENTLILSPPAGGKTSLLRETIRRLSNGGMRVGLADERSEVAAMCGAVPQLDVGTRTDVMDSAPKSIAVMTLLRCMSPQIIALDEITETADIEACASCFGCGVRILATAHARDISDLRRRPIYRDMLEREIFERAIIIHREDGQRRYEVVSL